MDLLYRNGDVQALLAWVQALEFCAILLIALSMLMLVIMWIHQVSWLLRLSFLLPSFLLPIAASVFAWRAAQHIHEVYFTIILLEEGFYGITTLHENIYIMEKVDSNLHDVVTLGWSVVAGTALLLILGGFVMIFSAKQQGSRNAGISAVHTLQ